MVTPGYAIKIELACSGFYGNSSATKVYLDKADAGAALVRDRAIYHKVKPHYAGQDWEVIELDVDMHAPHP